MLALADGSVSPVSSRVLAAVRNDTARGAVRICFQVTRRQHDLRKKEAKLFPGKKPFRNTAGSATVERRYRMTATKMIFSLTCERSFGNSLARFSNTIDNL